MSQSVEFVEFKRGNPRLTEGFLNKSVERKPGRWPGSPLNCKIESKIQQWLEYLKL